MLPGPGLGPAIVFLLGSASLARAQIFNCSSSSPYTQINTSAEATTLAQQCPASEISIELGSSISGNISLNGMQTCNNLICGNGFGSSAPDLISVRSNSLSVIPGSLNFQWLPALQTLSFPNLTQIGLVDNFWSLNLATLPQLTEFEFSPNLSTNDVAIFGTGLKSFSASLSGASNVLGLDIFQNPDLNKITLGLESCRDVFQIFSNAPGAVINLPNLKSLDICTLADFSGLNIPRLQSVTDGFNISNAQAPRLSAPSLQIVNNGFDLTGNFSEVDLPVLSVVNGYLNFQGAASSSGDFSSLDIPKLQSVSGSLSILNAQIYSFSAPTLRDVGSDFNLTGNFSELYLPMLSVINGNVYVRGATGLNCSLFEVVFVRGGTDCKGTAVPVSKPTITSSTSTATSRTSSTSPATSTSPAASNGTTSASAGLSSAAKGGIGGGVGGGALIIIAFAIWYSWRKRRSSKAFPENSTEPKLAHGKASPAELPRGHHHERSELEASPNQVSELTGDHKPRPRGLIESLPVQAPSERPVVVSDNEEMEKARVTNPAELDVTN